MSPVHTGAPPRAEGGDGGHHSVHDVLAAAVIVLQRYVDRDRLDLVVTVEPADGTTAAHGVTVDCSPSRSFAHVRSALANRLPAPRPAGRWTVAVADAGAPGDGPAARGELILRPGAAPTLALEHPHASGAALREAAARVLAAGTARPEQDLAALPVLSPAETDAQRRWLTGLPSRVPAETTIHALVRAAAGRHPERTAAACDAERLTYRQLVERSEHVAGALLTRGIARGEIVAVVAERSCATLTAALGVLTAGGAFFLLDPTLPAARRARLLAAAGVRLAVTTRAARAALPADRPAVVLEDLGPADARPEFPRSHGDDLAYLMFTSGSRGEPKGVLVRHRSFVNRQRWLIDHLALGPEDVSLGRTALSFDPAVCEMFRLLPVGGRVWFLPTGHERDPARVLDAIERERVTVVDLVPSPLRSLLEHVAALGLQPALSSLRWVLAGAETLHPWLVGLFEEVVGRRGGAHLLNGWGATEVCVDVTSFDCSAGPVGEPVPVGRPIPGVGVAVLDRHGRFTPLGVPGELYVRGRCLAAGYLNDAELTGERFVRRPVAGQEPLYRSGDRVRWRADGNLEFLGRLDDELSVRGLRVAPAEVEAVLCRHPAVDEAVVRVVGGGPSAEAGGGRLTAWVTRAAPSAPPDPEALRAHAGAFLPSGMVPEVVHVLDAFPRTAHDKVDVEALPTARPAPPGGPAAREAAGPPGSAEDVLAALWRDVLDGAAPGPDDDVLARGATSLDAARVATRAAAGVCGRLDVITIFAHPTIRAQAEVVRGCDHAACRVARLEPTPPAAAVPASHSQLRHWIASRFDATSSAYNIAIGVELTEVPDPGVLRTAVDGLVARHEILRTTFSLVDGELVQRVRPPEPGWVPVEHTTAADPSRLLRTVSERPFDTEAGPLLRLGLIAPAAADRGTVLYLVIHHLISDTWSLTLMLTELAARCRALATGDGPAEPPPARLQYRDYAAWERARLAGPAGRRLRRFWTDRLAGPPPALALPLDAPRGAAKAPGADVRRFVLGPEVTGALRSWAGERRATLFMGLLTAVCVWLHGLTGQRDLIVGTPVAGRPHVDLEDVLGSFVNSVALRTYVDPQASVDELLAGVRSAALDAFAHEEYPLDLVVRDLGLVRDPGRSALFDVMLVLQNAPGARTEAVWGEPRARRVDVDRGVGKLDMIVTFVEDEGGLRGEVEYDSHLFASTTVERWVAGLSTTIAALPHSSGTTVAAVAAAAPTATAPVLLHTAVERHARLTPGRPAVVCEDRVLTYGELDRRADRLARRLRDEFGVGPGRIVGYTVERTERVPVTQLAILKAGGAFLGIDPAHPEARRRAVLEDSRPALLVVDGHGRGLLPEGLEGLPVLALDEVPDARDDDEKADGLPPACGADDPAYVIYTSGSTGTPKGVVVEHANALALLWAGGWPFEFREDDVWTCTHSIAFDFSVWEVHLPLSRGARVVIVPEATRRDARRLLPALVRHGVTVLSQVPSTFERLVDELDRRPGRAPDRLRYVVLGGEPIRPGAVRRFAGHVPGADVVNGYGITETTVFTTFKRLDPSEAPGPPSDAQNIGRPIGTTSVDLLDADGRPVPDGAVGEIVISGPTVARGYLGRPDETARVFGTHAPDGLPPRRRYRSGDLARRLPSGDLVFAGRRDRQVKIRGHRVELDEVRAAILGTGLLTGDAATDARTGSAGTPSLVAYVDDRDRERIPALRRRLRELLLPAMVPDRFVTVADWPVTASGKVDLDALHARSAGLARSPAGDRSDGPAAPAPRGSASGTAAVLRALWGEVLGRPDPAPDDDFFALGGHSLLAVVLVTRVEEELGAALALEDVLTYPTLARQAELIDARRAPAARRPAGPPAAIRRVPDADDHPLSPAQSEFWLLDQFRDPETPAALPEVLDLGTPWDPAAARAAFAGLVESFEILRTGFPLVGDRPRQRIRPHGHEDALRLTDLSRSPAAGDLRALLHEEAAEPLDLAEGPLFRLHLVRRPGGTTLAVLTAHHIVWDGLSCDVLARWWRRDQRARRNGGAAPRPPARQFRDVAAHHLAHLESPAGRAGLAWWAERLAGTEHTRPDLTPLGIGRPSGPRDFLGCRRWVSLDARRTRALRALCADTGATLFGGLHALVKAFLFAMTGQTDLVVLSPVSLRDGPLLDEQLGPLINTVGIRDRVEPHASFAALLASVRRSVRDALAHRWVPPGDIGRALGLAADAPLADVGLTLQPRTPTLGPRTAADDAPRSEVVFGAHTPLWFDVTERADTLDVEIVAPRARADADALAALGRAFLRIAGTLLDHAGDPLDRAVGARPADSPAPLTIELRY
ncbi:amino acid adenylation domain-containing protein [Streptomyces mobaraensis NBRC 13819 = DSM 40847]|uniref:Non-ribosomal peptide synthetase module n=1 Tax=Streptomyces mobaraensis (strain ATCC 29032 / DSM 40847 / JCM 4168 / NBRC 13819 / NCIMB 11159 / IPCR 16-22) TaxID=1223523 RepID=M3B5E4_STRM1|nr:non-ribosomal peptide synthetase [Streptomyces mobaraensis]EMF01223.1 non-ribosomal peptide synthetase module [Streptomyces mobaraensis NBRC 13819 = DSM 40847]QTT76631.1 amino acid adenylation domain-containing protein [Streptomyces mobaraensis NBRC 13819 = DSM 40847]